MSDQEWSLIAGLVSDETPVRGRPSFDRRGSLDGIFWIANTGSAWRTLPAGYGAWNSVHRQYRRWSSAGLWRRMSEALRHAEVTTKEVELAKEQLAAKLKAVQSMAG